MKGDYMKKVKYIIVLLITIIIMPKVNAEGLCTKNVYEKLQEKVEKVEIKMENIDDSTKVEINNVDSDLIIYNNGMIYEPVDGKVSFTISKESNDYDIKFYGGYDHACVEEYIATKRLYNKYSEKEECKGNEEWELCDEKYEGYIKDDKEFEEKLDEYLKSDEKKEIEQEKEQSKNRTVFIIIGMVVLLIGGIYLIKVKNNKNKKVRKINRKSE